MFFALFEIVHNLFVSLGFSDSRERVTRESEAAGRRGVEPRRAVHGTPEQDA